MSSRKWRLWLVPVCAAALAGCGSAASSTPNPTTPVARVGSAVITLAAFNTRLQSTTTAIHQAGGPSADPAMTTGVRADVLRSLILDAVIAQEAAALGQAITDKEVQAEVAKDAQSVGGMSQLQTQLASAGGSIPQLEDEIRSQGNEQRVEDRFAQQRAAMIEQTLAGGADFAQTATQESDDNGTASKGGDLGALSAQDLSNGDQTFAATVHELAAGAYTKAPIHDSGGYDIIQLYAQTATTWSVRHILVAAPNPYTVQDRPGWFATSLFTAVAQDCTSGQIHVYLKDAGADPCVGAPALTPSPTPAG
ncbi:MAG: SurA N-terminal domain-containing protein [Candidatus Dormibacteraeota bacterium]|nr:SurA N-terminal domain-containing protein [Candidatus Dormibacteraeota bacterium]